MPGFGDSLFIRRIWDPEVSKDYLMKGMGLRMGTVAYDQGRGGHAEEEIVLSLLFQVKKAEGSCAVAYSGIMKTGRREGAINHYQENF